MSMSQPLSGKVALVTGAGKRVGRAIALELAGAGADLVVHVNRSVEDGQRTADQVRALGRKALVVKADQRNVSEIEFACGEARKELPPPDILVNSAAIWPKGTLETVRQRDFDLAIEVNLRGPFFWMQCLGLSMKERGSGCIVNIIDSTLGRPSPDALPYYAAKGGLLEMTFGFAKALAPAVRVNAVAPGPVLFPDDYTEDQVQADREATLLGTEGSPEAVARAVRFLCQEEFMTGSVLHVDGGFRFGV
jgi:NAD(P)-dependent dehydrogenase (short-subunit alcohol dehydrogenase family)